MARGFLAFRFEANASLLPSGENIGKLSNTLLKVMRCKPLPSLRGADKPPLSRAPGASYPACGFLTNLMNRGIREKTFLVRNKGHLATCRERIHTEEPVNEREAIPIRPAGNVCGVSDDSLRSEWLLGCWHHLEMLLAHSQVKNSPSARRTYQALWRRWRSILAQHHDLAAGQEQRLDASRVH